MNPFIYADFQNATVDGRIRLNTTGTREDLTRLGLALEEGILLTLYTDDGDDDRGMTIEGVVERDAEEGGWVAAVDWSKVHRTRSESTRHGVLSSIPSTVPASLVG